MQVTQAQPPNQVGRAPPTHQARRQRVSSHASEELIRQSGVARSPPLSLSPQPSLGERSMGASSDVSMICNSESSTWGTCTIWMPHTRSLMQKSHNSITGAGAACRTGADVVQTAGAGALSAATGAGVAVVETYTGAAYTAGAGVVYSAATFSGTCTAASSPPRCAE